MSMCPSMTYTSCAISSKGTNWGYTNVRTVWRGGFIIWNRNDAEIGDKYDDNSIMPPVLREKEIDATDSGDESIYYPMSTEMLKYIRDRSQSRPNNNRSVLNK